MPVAVRLPTVLRSQAGGHATVVVEGATTISDVLQGLVGQYPGMAGQVLNDDGSLHRFVNVYVNDDDIRYLQKEATPLRDGDTISIVPSIAGGSTGNRARAVLKHRES